MEVVMKQAIRSILRAAGLEITRARKNPHELPDQPEWVNRIIGRVMPFTMTTPERIAALCQSVAYLHRYKVPKRSTGFVEPEVT